MNVKRDHETNEKERNKRKRPNSFVCFVLFRLFRDLSFRNLLKASLILAMFSALVLADQSSQQKSGKSFAPGPEWRPTNAPPGTRYLGNAACAQCHIHGETQQTTPMAQALELVAECNILRANKRLTFQSGKYSYTITREGDRSIYQVTDGKGSVIATLLYAFGQGKAGQTYVFELNGKYYESRISFFNEINGLDYTLGAPHEPAKTLEEAAGRIMDSADVKDCFGCHSTGAVSESKLQLDRLSPGVTCEGCHGPGEKHVALMKSLTGKPKPADKQMFNPGHFDTEGQTQFCGSCHRTWTHVQLMGVQGVGNVRFQPYRIFKSKCYDFDDKRISCTACHNPHEALREETTYYDAKCTACHQSKNDLSTSIKHGSACKAGKQQNCASCHMPEYEIPGSHFKFTDHLIRVVRPGEAYPN
jgi:Cytochrome c554 and c-prime